MITATDITRTVAAALLVAAVAAGCASRTTPAADPLAAPSPASSPTPDASRSPVPVPPQQEPSPGAMATTDETTDEASLQPTQEPESTATEPSPSSEDDGLTELPSFDSGGMAPTLAMTITLHADPATGCMWISLQRGEGDTQAYATRFNQQYRGRFTRNPPELVRIDHDTGEPVVVAAAGETFEGAAQHVEGQLDECHVGPEGIVALLY